MDNIYTILIALVIGLVSFSTAFWGGIFRCLSPREILNMLIAFMIFQTGFFCLGTFSGTSFSGIMGWLSIPIAEAIILLSGIKLIFSAFKSRPVQKSINLGKIGELLAVAFASSLNAFMIGLGIGLLRPLKLSMIIGIVLSVLIFSLIGVYTGKRQGRLIYATFAGIIAGVILIILGAMLLLDLYQVI